MVTLPNIPRYQTDAFIDSGYKRKPEPIGIAAAAIALGLDENEMREFVYRVERMQDIPNVSVEYVYQSLIRIAYEIRERRSTIGNG